MDLNKHFESFFSPDEINDMLSKYDDSDIESTKQMFNDQLREYGIDLEELERDFENYTPKLDLGYRVLNHDAVTPKYNYVSDSGFDLHSVEDLEIPPFGRILVPTGLSFDIKDINPQKLGIQHVAKKDIPSEWLEECLKKGEEPKIVKKFF